MTLPHNKSMKGRKKKEVSSLLVVENDEGKRKGPREPEALLSAASLIILIEINLDYYSVQFVYVEENRKNYFAIACFKNFLMMRFAALAS